MVWTCLPLKNGSDNTAFSRSLRRHHTATMREKAWSFERLRGADVLAKNRAVKNIATAAQVAAVRKHDRDAAQHAHLALSAGVPQPLSRTEQTGRIGDGAGVEKGAELHGENAVAVDIFVQLPVGEEVAAAERRCALAPAGSAGMSAKPEIVVAFDAELKQFVERGAAERAAGAPARAHFVVVAGGSRQAAGGEGSTRRGEGSQILREGSANACFRAGIEGEAALRRTKQRAIGPQPVSEEGCVREAGLFRRGGGAVQVAKRTIGNFDTGAPTPLPIRNGMELSAACNAAQI